MKLEIKINSFAPISYLKDKLFLKLSKMLYLNMFVNQTVGSPGD